MKEFNLEMIDEETLRGFAIPFCENHKHKQQVAFSTYHNALTQICYNCKKIRTTCKDFA